MPKQLSAAATGEAQSSCSWKRRVSADLLICPASVSQEVGPLMEVSEGCPGACRSCSRTCLRIHGNWASSSSNPLLPACFCKTVADYSDEGGPTCWMQVPAVFVRRYFPDVKRQSMTLENLEGWRWPVTFSGSGFYSGWREFAADNRLGIGDTIIFSLVEENRFLVEVFDKLSGCERFVAPGRITKIRKRDCFGRQQQQHNNTKETKGRFPGAFYGSGGTQFVAPVKSDDDNTAIQNLLKMKKKRRLSHDPTSKREMRSQSVPAPNFARSARTGLAEPELGSFEIGRRRSTCSATLKVQTPRWQQTQARVHVARELVRKAKLRKLNLTNLPQYNKHWHAGGSRFKSLQSGDGVLEGSSSFAAGEAGGVPSFGTESKLVADTTDSDFDEGEDQGAEAACRLQQKGKSTAYCSKDFSNFSTGNNHKAQVQAHATRDHAFTREIASPRTRGSPRTDPVVDPRVPLSTGAAAEAGQPPMMKRKRGRPFKHESRTDFISRPGREIFVSQRRPVTQAEIEDALQAAYEFASRMKSTNVIIVMRQSFIYRNFVLGIPRKFALRNMPDCNKDVRLCDRAWKAWYCSWNSAYKYISGRGWRNFALEHCLEEDDALVLESIEEIPHLLTLMVHIFRVVDIPEGVTGWQSHRCPPSCFPELNSGTHINPIPRSYESTRPACSTGKTRRGFMGSTVKREPMQNDTDESSSMMESSSEELD